MDAHPSVTVKVKSLTQPTTPKDPFSLPSFPSYSLTNHAPPLHWAATFTRWSSPEQSSFPIGTRINVPSKLIGSFHFLLPGRPEQEAREAKAHKNWNKMYWRCETQGKRDQRSKRVGTGLGWHMWCISCEWDRKARQMFWPTKDFVISVLNHLRTSVLTFDVWRLENGETHESPVYRALDIGAFNAIAEDQGLTRCKERLAVCKDKHVIVISETTQHVKRVTQTRNRYSQERNTLFVLPYRLEIPLDHDQGFAFEPYDTIGTRLCLSFHSILNIK